MLTAKIVEERGPTLADIVIPEHEKKRFLHGNHLCHPESGLILTDTHIFPYKYHEVKEAYKIVNRNESKVIANEVRNQIEGTFIANLLGNRGSVESIDLPIKRLYLELEPDIARLEDGFYEQIVPWSVNEEECYNRVGKAISPQFINKALVLEGRVAQYNLYNELEQCSEKQKNKYEKKVRLDILGAKVLKYSVIANGAFIAVLGGVALANIYTGFGESAMEAFRNYTNDSEFFKIGLVGFATLEQIFMFFGMAEVMHSTTVKEGATKLNTINYLSANTARSV